MNAADDQAGDDQTVARAPTPGSVVLVSGARAAEEALLADLDALLSPGSSTGLPAGILDLALLARPVRIVVPSRSLRDHLAAAIVRRHGRAVAGVVVQTLRALALEILERTGSARPLRGSALFDVLVRRMAREEASLHQGLDGLVDGYKAVSATVRDLLDAGLVPTLLGEEPVLDLAEAADEALATDGPEQAGEVAVARARALVRTAASVARAQHLLGVGRTAQLLTAAEQALRRDPDAAAPARAVLVAGFADATGVATDLLVALLERPGSRFYLDRPPDPGGAKDALEEAFAERLRRRLELSAGEVSASFPLLEAPRLECFEAPGGEAEVLEAARRVRTLLDTGARPEGIALVARDLEGYRLHLPRLLASQGIPFHAPTLRTSPDPAGRLARGLVELLRRGGEIAVDRWLDLCSPASFTAGSGPDGDGSTLLELRLAFHAQGAGRLAQAAELRPEEVLRRDTNGRSGLPLPLFHGLAAEGDDDPSSDLQNGEGPSGGAVRARRRWLEGEALVAAVAAAQRLLTWLHERPEGAPAERWFDELHAMLRRDLGWRPGGDAPPGTVEAALEELRRQIPGILDLERDELTLLVEGALEEIGRRPLAGLGGGVRVLDVTETRGLTFDHVFLLGLNRDLFPRVVREDPLLADDLRRVLQRVLPDTPLKTRGHDEERHLFAQLLSASPRVTLSWQILDDEGSPRAPSPLLARLRWGRDPLPEPTRAAPRFAPPAAGDTALRSAAEHATLAGLYGGRERFAGLLPLVDGVGDERGRALLAGLSEIDPGLPAPPPGPYFGFIGALGGAGDPRRRELWVTHLEHVAACPWQAFVQRLLRVEPVPDPLAALPDLGALLVGQLVHAALEAIVRRTLEPDGHPAHPPRAELEAVLARAPVLVPWPDAAELDELLDTAAHELLIEEGIGLPGLARPLAARARPYLEAARDELWPAGGEAQVLGAEVVGVVTLPGSDPARRLRFRADLVTTGEDGPQLIDFKTGKPVSDAKQPATRARHLERAVARGERLQAVAYALALEARGGGGYLFLKPELAPEHRHTTVEAGAGSLRQPFEHATGGVLEVWDQGAFFPRLVDPDTLEEPGRCQWCTVAEACLRGDSGARRRLVEGVETWTAEELEGRLGDPQRRALLAGWRLASKDGGGREEEP